MPNDYWKISQGTSEDSEKQPLHVDLVSGDEFDLIERVKEVCGTPALERKIFLHRNGQTYGPYSRSSVERFLLENLASPNDWARFQRIRGGMDPSEGSFGRVEKTLFTTKLF